MAKRLTREQQLEKARAIEEKVRRDDFHATARDMVEAIRESLAARDYVMLGQRASLLERLVHGFMHAEEMSAVPADEAAP